MSGDAMVTVNFVLNGRKVEATVPAHFTLLRMIREHFRLTGSKWSCEMGECGVCTMLVDGSPVPTCLILAGQVQDRRVDTIEGITATPLGECVVEAFADCGAVQCGYCTPGMAVATYALVRDNPDPTEEEARLALSGVLCRCTGYVKIIEGALKTARLWRKKQSGTAVA